MKSKKVIAFLCAAAMTVSTFAGLSVSASAAADKAVSITPTEGSKVVTVKADANADSGVLLHAVYANGALSSIEAQNFAEGAEDTTVTFTKDNYVAYANGTGSKILAWDSLANMEPMTVNIVEPPAPKTQVSTVAEVAITRVQDDTYPATLTAAVTAKTGATFEDTTSFTYSWTKDGVAVNGGTDGTLTGATAGSYIVTATYNNDNSDFEGNLISSAFAVEDPGDTRTSVADLVTVTITAANDNTKTPTTLTAAVADVQDIETPTGLTADDFTYAWTKDGVAVDGETGKTLAVTEAGEYKVVATVKSDNATYKGSAPQSAGITITEPVQAEPYVTSTDGKIKAISLYGSEYNEVSQADKTYKQLKEDGVVTAIESRNGTDSTGGETTYAEGVLLADSTTITSGKVASGQAITVVEVDIADVIDKAATHRISLTFDALTTFNSFNSEIYVSKLTAPDELADLTYTALTELTISGETSVGWGGRYTDAAAMTKVITADVAAAAEADETKLYYAIYTKARENALSNFALTTEQLHTVTIDSNITGGTVTADKTADLLAGDKVVITITPTEGYDYTTDSLSVKDASNAPVAVSAVEGETNKYEFTMPDSNVTVTAAFAQIQLDPSVVTINYKNGEDTVKTDTVNGYIGRAIDLTDKLVGFNVDNDDNATFKHYTVNDGAQTSITPSAATATVDIAVSTNGRDYYYFNDYSVDDSKDWTIGNDSRGQVTIADNKAELYGQYNMGGTTITSPNWGVTADTYKAEFKLALTGCKGTSSSGAQEATFNINDGGTGQVLSLKSSAPAGSGDVANVWTIQNAVDADTTVTLTTGKEYSYTITRVTSGGTTTSLLTIKDGASAVVTDVPITIANAGIKNVTFSYGRWNPKAVLSEVEVYTYTAPVTPTRTDLGGKPAVKAGAETVTTATTNTALTADITNVTPATTETLTYKWQKAKVDAPAEDTDWEDVSGATTASYTPTEAGKYRVVVSAPESSLTIQGSVASDAVTVTAPTPAAKKITWADTLTGFTVKRAGTSGDTVIQTNEELVAGDVIKIEATVADKKVKSVTATGATFEVKDGVATYTVPTEVADIAITAVELEDVAAPVTKYTVEITADEGISNVKLGTKEGTKAENKYTFTEVEAGEYTFDVTYVEGYEAVQGTPTSITVAADKTTETIASQKTKYTLEANGDNASAIALKVGGADAASSIEWGIDVTVEVTVPDGKKLTALTYTPAGGEATDILTAKTFKMPKANVTVQATFANLTLTKSSSVTNAGAFAVKVGETPATGDSTDITKDNVITITAADAYHTITAVTADGAEFTVTDGVATATVTNADVVINSVTVEEKTAPTISAATIEDHNPDSTKVIAKENLAKNYSVTETDGTIAITANDLVKHYNDDTTPTLGYWVGAKVTSDSAITGYVFQKDAITIDASTEWKTPAEGDDSFYVNVGDENEKKYLAIKLADERTYSYTFDVTGVTRVFAITAADVADEYSFTTPPTSATEGDTVTVTVVAAGTKTITEVKANDTTATKGTEANTWTFTMPAEDVAITATAANTSNEAPKSITVTGDAAVAQNGTATYTATVYDESGHVTSQSGVTWAVYTNAEATTTADKSEISEAGVLSVGADETAETLYIVATSSVEGSTDVKSTAKAVTVSPVYVKQLVSFTRLTNEGAAIPSGYVVATADSDNDSFFLTAINTIEAALTGEEKLAAEIKDGKAELYLNPNKTYKLTLKTAEDGVVIAEDIAYTPTAGAETTAVNNAIAAAATPAAADIPEGVSLTADAIPGDVVTVTLPAGDYVVNDVKVYKDAEGTEEVTVTKDEETGAYTFVMPVGGVKKVVVDKTDLYAVTNATTDTNGSISIDKEKAAENDTVTITVTPKDATYILDTLIVKDADDAVVTTNENEGKYTFTMPAKAVNVTATFKLVSYTVTFDVDGDSAVEAATVNHGAKVTKPATDPTKEGNRFDGWYSDAEKTTAFDFDDTTITANTTIYAKWVEQVTITVGGKDYVIDKGASLKDAEITDATPDDETKEFKGWKVEGAEDDTAITTAALKAEDKTFNASATYVAVFAAKAPTTYDVVFKKNAEATEATKTVTTNVGTAVASSEVPEGPADDSGVFLGWYLSTDETKTVVTDWTKVTEAGTYYAKYDPYYTLTAATVTGGTLAITEVDGVATELTKSVAGKTVKFSVTPDSGYQLVANSVKATYNDGTDEQELTVANNGLTADNTTYTFTMPTANVSISAEFEAVYAVTFEAPTNGTLAVAKGEDTLTSGDTVAAGSTITITATPADFYKIDTLTIGGTAYTKAADAENPTATEYVVAADGTVTATATVTAATAVAATFTENIVFSYDYDTTGDGTAFNEVNRMGSRTVVDDPTANETDDTKNQVLKLQADNNASNDVGYARIKFADSVANARAIKVEFDSYEQSTQPDYSNGNVDGNRSSHRISVSLYDANIRTSSTKTKGSYPTDGVIFNEGSLGRDNFKVQGEQAASNPYDKWVHTVVTIDQTTGKVSYKVTDSDNSVLKEATNAAYIDTSAAYVNGFEVYTSTSYNILYLDNLKVYTATDETKPVAINYVDSEGTVLKTARTTSAALGTVAKAYPSDKVAFDYTDSETSTKYYCTYSGTTDSVTVTGEAETDKIDLVFTKTPYVTVPVKHVYQDDENGTIEVGEHKYVSFGTDGSTTDVSGRTYTTEDSYKTAINDKAATNAFYVFNSQLTSTYAAETPLYVLYDRYVYKITTFSLTIPDGLTTEAALDVPIKVTGTPTAVGADAVDATVTVTVEQNATTGSATIDLLDSTDGYSYVIDDVAQKYLGTTGSAVAAGSTVEKTLAANSKTPATITVKYVDATNTETVIKTETIDQGVYVGEEYTAADTYKADFTKQVGETTVPYKKYTYYADGSDSLTITPTGTDDVITLKYDTDGKQYYLEEDFESYSSTDDVKASSLTRGKWYAKDYDGITLGTDSTNYVRMVPAAGKTRGARYQVPQDVENTVPNTYKIEFDTRFTSGQKSAQSSVIFGDTSSGGQGYNGTYSANYIFQTSCDGGKTVNITDGDPASATVDNNLNGWVHYVLTVDTTNSKVGIVITDTNNGSVYTGESTINGTGKLGYIQIVGPSNYSSMSCHTDIDNIKIYVTE